MSEQEPLLSIAEHKIREIEGILNLVSGTDYQVRSIERFTQSLREEVAGVEDTIRNQFRSGVFDARTLQAHMGSLNCSLAWAKRLKESSLNDAPWWVAPLIANAASNSNVVRCQRDDVVVFLDQDQGLHVYPHIGPQRFRLPVFGCPTEFDYSPILAGTLFHEVGHLWYRSCPTSDGTGQETLGQSAIQSEIWSTNWETIRKTLVELVGHDLDSGNTGLFEQFEAKRKLDEFQRVFSSHLEELMCDEVARRIGGPSFDVALALMFSSRAPNSVSLSHPSDVLRLKRSKDCLEEFCNECAKVDPHVGQDIKVALSCIVDLLGMQIARGNTSKADKTNLAVVSESLASEFVEDWITSVPDEPKSRGQQHWADTDPFDVAKFVKDFPRALRQVELLLPLFEIMPTKESLDRDFESSWEHAALSATQILAYYSVLRFDSGLAGKFDKASYVEDGETSRARNATLEHLKAAVDISDSTVRAYKLFVEENKGALSSMDYKVVRQRGDIDPKDKGKDANPSDDGSIVMTPILCPNKQARAGSLDLRLGTTFLQLKSEIVGTVDPWNWANKNSVQLPSQRFRRVYRSIGQKYLLHPHEFALATVLEYVFLPENYFANVLGRSSWGRMGLTIATATAVSPWYRGRLTLELKNVGTSPIALVVGSRVAQLYFTPLGKELSSVYVGKYLGPVDAEAPPLESDKDWHLLRQIAPFGTTDEI